MKKVVLLLGVLIVFIYPLYAQYKVGDIYNENGVKGIVYKIVDDGQHGMIMSLDTPDKKNCVWCTDKKLYLETRAYYEDKGQKNMDAIIQYVEANSLNWEVFPLFAWCRQKGEG